MGIHPPCWDSLIALRVLRGDRTCGPCRALPSYLHFFASWVEGWKGRCIYVQLSLCKADTFFDFKVSWTLCCLQDSEETDDNPQLTKIFGVRSSRFEQFSMWARSHQYSHWWKFSLSNLEAVWVIKHQHHDHHQHHQQQQHQQQQQRRRRRRRHQQHHQNDPNKYIEK